MYLIYKKNIFLDLFSSVSTKVVSITIALFLSWQTSAESQTKNMMDHTHPSVTVDLSVIYGGNSSQTSNFENGILPSISNRNLLRPGNQNPKSMLHLPAAKGTPLSPAAKSVKVINTPKSTLHVPPVNSVSTMQTEKKQKTKIRSKKTRAKLTEPAINKLTKKSPPPAPSVSSPKKKVVPIKPATTAKAPKKLEAQTNQVTTKSEPVPLKKVEQINPPSTPTIKPAPKTVKKTTPAQATPSVNKNLTRQQASLPPISTTAETAKLRITFSQDQTKLPESAKASLLSMAASMKGATNQRLQLMAYAGGTSLSSSLARRMSLSRALAIRSFLIENGVRSTRIDVRALGNKTTEEPFNRVDLKFTER